jgi:thioredoxin reductase
LPTWQISLAELAGCGNVAVMSEQWECVIIGGGAAGLSAALVLGRARRRVLVVDAGEQSNLAAHGIGGLLGHDGEAATAFYDHGRDELSRYPSVSLRTGSVISATAGFRLELASGAVEHSRTILLATGMHYDLPRLAGIYRLWGRSVFHCPFCHGWEMRDRSLAVIARGERALHSALLLRGWTDDITILSNGASGLDDADRARLSAAGVRVDERQIARLISDSDELTAVEFTDGTLLARSGALVAASTRQRSNLATQLGVATTAGPLAEDAIVIDRFHRTSVRGVFAAGDTTASLPQVAVAIAAGSAAGAAVAQALLADDVGLPVPDWPAATADRARS